MDYFMWFTTGTETLTSKSNQEHKYPRALLSADMVTHFDYSSPKNPIRYVYCYLLPKFGPDYLNTQKNVLITWLRAQTVHTSGQDRPVPAFTQLHH